MITRLDITKYNSNTTFVKVKFQFLLSYMEKYKNSNTTFVKVKLTK